MKLATGQRWLRLKNDCYNDACLRYKIVEIIQPNQYNGAKCKVIATDDELSWPVGYVYNFAAFPASDEINKNEYWEYMLGQDKPKED